MTAAPPVCFRFPSVPRADDPELAERALWNAEIAADAEGPRVMVRVYVTDGNLPALFIGADAIEAAGALLAALGIPAGRQWGIEVCA